MVTAASCARRVNARSMDIAAKQFLAPRTRASGPGESGRIMTKTRMNCMIVRAPVEEDAQHGPLGRRRHQEARDKVQKVHGLGEVPVHPIPVVLMQLPELAVLQPPQHRLSPMAEGCVDE